MGTGSLWRRAHTAGIVNGEGRRRLRPCQDLRSDCQRRSSHRARAARIIQRINPRTPESLPGCGTHEGPSGKLRDHRACRWFVPCNLSLVTYGGLPCFDKIPTIEAMSLLILTALRLVWLPPRRFGPGLRAKSPNLKRSTIELSSRSATACSVPRFLVL